MFFYRMAFVFATGKRFLFDRNKIGKGFEIYINICLIQYNGRLQMFESQVIVEHPILFPP